MKLTAQEKRDALTHKPEDVDKIWALALAKKWNDGLVAGQRFYIGMGGPYAATQSNIASVIMVNGSPKAAVTIPGQSHRPLVEDCEFTGTSDRDEAIEELEIYLGRGCRLADDPFRHHLEKFVDRVIAAAKVDNPK